MPANSRCLWCGRGLAQLRGAGAEALLARYAAPEEVMELPSRCAACGAPCTTRMFQCDIPFFKARSARLALPRNHSFHIVLWAGSLHGVSEQVLQH